MSTLPKYMTDLAVNPQEAEYLRMMHDVRQFGEIKTDRTGTGTKSDFGKMMRFNLQHGLPLLTTKKIHLKSIIHEVLWFLSGSTNIRYLKENGVSIWDEWADARGELGPVYGKQWRRWEDTKLVSMVFEADKVEQLLAQGYRIRTTFPEHIQRDGCSSDDTVAVMQKEYDQIQDAMDLIKHNPDSRRIIVNAWNVADVAGMALPPCHAMYQFYVSTMTLDERIAYRDSLSRIDEEAWRRESKDWMENEFRTYRYGRSLWADDEEQAHLQLDRAGIPRKKLSCMLYQRSIH